MFENIKIDNSKKTFLLKVGLKTYKVNVFDTTEKWEIYVECEGAWIKQPYLKEDLPDLLTDLPLLIEEYQSEKKDAVFQIRLTANQKIQLEKNAEKNWFKHISDFIKNRCLA